VLKKARFKKAVIEPSYTSYKGNYKKPSKSHSINSQ